MLLRAVTFDFWNTLVAENPEGARPRRVDAWMALLEGEGVALEREAVHEAMASSSKAFEDRWRANMMFNADDAVDHALSRLGLEPPADVRAELVHALTDPPSELDPSPTPNVGDCLRTLHDAGVRIGIICDVGLTPSRTLRRYLDGHGLLELFDHWSFSDEVGTFKPDPKIFEHALDGLGGVEPADAAHVGDLRRTDVAGAAGMGMTSVRYTGVFDDPGPDDGSGPEAHIVIADHAELPAALGIG